MFVQTFTKENFFDMDAMHDCYIEQISLEDKTLVITYNNLDEGLVDPNGEPIYKHKKLVARYEFESYCDVEWHSEKKYDVIDFYKKPEEFHKKFKNYVFCNYTFSVNNFYELFLNLTAYKLKKNKETCSKFFGIEIMLDAKRITYTWE